MEIPKGIWYEEKRSRWRVKLADSGVLLCCSYHRNYDDAYKAWREVKRSIVRPRPKIPIQESSPVNQFICQPLTGAGRVQGH
jgi:hypothetical protein